MFDMAIEFLAPPSMTIHTEHGLLEILSTRPWETNKELDKYKVRSNFIVDIIAELESKQDSTVYNAQVQDHITHLLGRADLREKSGNAEENALRSLVYNAQGFRRNDLLEKDGYVVCTKAILEDACKKKLFIKSEYGRVLKPRIKDGTLYAMFPKSKTKYAQVMGLPIKVLDKKAACPL